MNLYDTHAHVYGDEYKDQYYKIITDSLDKGVWLNNVGTHKHTSVQAVKIANDFPNGVYAVIGVHPTSVSHDGEKLDYDFFKILSLDSKVVGIGECGLDYYRQAPGMSLAEMKAVQKEAFLEHIRLAKEIDKPLVLHLRASSDSTDAYEDALEMLSQEEGLRFIVHSFTSTWEIAQKFIAMGGLIALNGIITFDKTGALDEVIKQIPLEKLVLETDAPYLAPEPFRGKQNFPEYVQYTAQFIAERRGTTVEEIAEQTFNNARKFFRV